MLLPCFWMPCVMTWQMGWGKGNVDKRKPLRHKNTKCVIFLKCCSTEKKRLETSDVACRASPCEWDGVAVEWFSTVMPLLSPPPLFFYSSHQICNRVEDAFPSCLTALIFTWSRCRKPAPAQILQKLTGTLTHSRSLKSKEQMGFEK